MKTRSPSNLPSKHHGNHGLGVWSRIVILHLLLATCLCAQTYDDFVLLIDTSGKREDKDFRARLRVGLDNYADTIPADAASRVWLFTYDTALTQQESAFVLGDPQKKTDFKLTLAKIPEPRKEEGWTWSALTGALDKLSAAAKDSRTLSIHLFVDGAAKDPKVTFAQAFAKFSGMRRARPNLRLYYHALGFEPPDEIKTAATPDSGLNVIRGIKMPPQILRDRVLPPRTELLSGAPRAWTGVAVGSAEKWQWTFGDGKTEALVNPTHTYAKSGKYKLEVTASSADGKDSDSAKFDLDVKAGPPKPAFEIKSGYAGSATMFTDSSQGEIERREWTVEGKPAGEGPKLEHVFAVPGQFPVSLTVTGPGGKDTAKQDATILPQAKVQFSWRPQNAVSNAPVAFINGDC